MLWTQKGKAKRKPAVALLIQPEGRRTFQKKRFRFDWREAFYGLEMVTVVRRYYCL